MAPNYYLELLQGIASPTCKSNVDCFAALRIMQKIQPVALSSVIISAVVLVVIATLLHVQETFHAHWVLILMNIMIMDCLNSFATSVAHIFAQDVVVRRKRKLWMNCKPCIFCVYVFMKQIKSCKLDISLLSNFAGTGWWSAWVYQFCASYCCWLC